MSFNIAVLLGGTSAERDVSLVTGMEIARALRQKGHRATAIDCAYGAQIIDNLNQDTSQTIRITPSEIEKQRKELDRNILKTADFLIEKKFDAVFIALHGGYGENGRLQALLDLIGISYTGSGALASGLGMDKHLSKVLFMDSGVPTPSWIKLQDAKEWLPHLTDSWGYPLVVKPNEQGSTVGLSIVKAAGEVPAAINNALRFGPGTIIEKFIPGRELTVSILNSEPLPIVEIIPEKGIYDYESKYQQGKSRYVTPAELPVELAVEIQNYARTAYSVLGCRHYARVDFRLTPDNEAFCLEVNTLPGMTSTSLVPKAARAVGIEFPDLVEKIILLAMKENNI